MQPHRLKALAFGLLFGLAWTMPAYGTPGERFYVREDNTNIHEDPTATAPVVRHLNKGDRVIEFRRQGSWVKVSQLGAVGKDGWVEISRLAPEPRKTGGAVGKAPKPEQVVELIESPPKVTRGRCPAFNAATIDKCFQRFSRSLFTGIHGPPYCVDKPRKPRTSMTINVQPFSEIEQFPPRFHVSVGRGQLLQWKARLRAETSQGARCGNTSRIKKSQAHSCRREILRSATWRRLC